MRECEECNGNGNRWRTISGHEECGCWETEECETCNGSGEVEDDEPPQGGAYSWNWSDQNNSPRIKIVVDRILVSVVSSQCSISLDKEILEMPSSWSESNRLHSSNQREDAANDALASFDYVDDAPDDSYLDGDFDAAPDGSFEDYAEDRYLDSYMEDRYYMPEVDFDY